MNAALKADLNGASIPSLDGSALYLFEAEIVGPPAQVFAKLAF